MLSLTEFKEGLVNALSHVVNFMKSCEGHGVEHNDLYGSLPTWFTLEFHE